MIDYDALQDAAEEAYRNRPEEPLTDAEQFALDAQADVDGKHQNEQDDLR